MKYQTLQKNGKKSNHNLDCWKQEEYVGLGLAAHSYMDNTRYSNTENMKEYINGSDRIVHEVQTKEIRQKEYMLLGLRKIEGVKISEFKNKFVDNPVYLFKDELNKLVGQKLLQIDVDSIKLTKKGIDFANIVWSEFV